VADLTDIFLEGLEDEEELPRAVDVAESANPARDFIDDLVYWLENVKTEPPRAPGLHCSSLWKTCARKELLKTQYADYVKAEVIKAGSRMTFDMGHALHDMIQNIYLGPAGRLWGDWKCVNCQDIVFRGTLPEACPKCDIPWRNEKDGHQNIVYAELFVKDEDLDYCGHCDGVILGRTGKKRVFEFKTKSKSQFESLRRPDTPHIIQVHAYMNAMNLEEAILLYWDKGSQCDWSRNSDGTWNAGTPHLKAYRVEFDHELWASIVARIHDYHKAHKLIRDLPTINGESVMKFRRICSHDKCDLAKECEVKAYCFKLPK